MHSYLLPAREQVVVTVGHSSSDIIGCDSAAIQKAIDVAKTRGGGVVHIAEGIFEISAPVKLSDNIILRGSGDRTVLYKTDAVNAGFSEDADYGELKVSVDTPGIFKSGMGIQLYDKRYGDNWAVTTAVITEIEKNTLYLDTFLLRDYEADGGGFISSSCSLIEGIGIHNAGVCDLSIDGNGSNNDYLNGCRGGGIYFHWVGGCFVENVKVRNFNGDGISWQTTEDMTIRRCEVFGCFNYGLHPGTGSLRSVVEDCSIYDNKSDGLFVCWRVKFGSFKGNRIYGNSGNGINIGHKDTDNLFAANHIYGNASCGIYVRPEKQGNNADRNTYSENVIEDNGSEGDGACSNAGILIDSAVQGTVIRGNNIRDTGKGVQKNGLVIKAAATGLILQDNEMSGHGRGDVVRFA